MIEDNRKSVVLFACVFALTVTVCLPALAFEYEAYGRRDPFIPLVGAGASSTGGGVSSILTVEDVILQGITVGPGSSTSVIMNGEILNEGAKIERVQILEIKQNSVVIMIDEQQYEVKLYE